jgi:SH3-like domain-containing protein
VQQSTSEFNKQNFGGALYLANQAKSIAESGRSRAAGSRGAARSGETQFAVPIRLKATSRGNVREGPGTSFAVAFPVESGSALTAYAYSEDWVRVSDDSGRAGWIFRGLVGRP